MIRALSFFVLFIGMLSACGNRADVRIAAASSFMPVLDSIAMDFEKETGLKAEISYGASGMLITQIMEGADYDIYITANWADLTTLKKSTVPIVKNEYLGFGSIVLITPHKLENAAQFPEVLRNPEVRSIAMPNPKTAPYGAMFFRELATRYQGLKEELETKWVYAENASQVIPMIQSGSAQAGITSLSNLLATGQAEKYHYVNLSDFFETYVENLSFQLGKADNKNATQFMEYLKSGRAEAWLATYGFQKGRPNFQ